MDTGLDENEAELAVLVLAVALKVLADGDGLQKMSEYMTCEKRFELVRTFLIKK